MSRLRVTTKSGSIYMIDMDQQTAERVKGVEANDLPTDGDVFAFTHLFALDGIAEGDELTSVQLIMRAVLADVTKPTVGRRLLLLRDFGYPAWQLSTEVISIEEVDA